MASNPPINFSYQMAQSPSPPMSDADYEQKVMKEWDALLNANPPEPEEKFQAFFEKHPAMVPGAYSTSANPTAHGPLLAALVSQPPLRGLETMIPDFMWLSKNSAVLSPVFVEIERPDKKWFNQNGDPTAKFTQAQHQLAAWKQWMSEPANILYFRDFFAIPDFVWNGLALRPQYILVYGRAAEATSVPEFNKRRYNLQRSDEQYMTFDRLALEKSMTNMLCVKMDGPGKFRAITWPPVCTLSPDLAYSRRKIDGIADAIAGSDGIQDDRRQFLISRLPYWNAWATPYPSAYRMFDKE